VGVREDDPEASDTSGDAAVAGAPADAPGCLKYVCQEPQEKVCTCTTAMHSVRACTGMRKDGICSNVHIILHAEAERRS
jgi:hypothetical protein